MMDRILAITDLCRTSAVLWSVSFILLLGGLSPCHDFNVEAQTFGNKDVTQNEKYTSGEERYNLMKKESKMPRYGECWLNALAALETGCKQLSDDTQHRLAFKFANCFLAKTGRAIHNCEDDEDLAECSKGMSSEAYHTYLEFFTHFQNICFFLEAQAWQAMTEDTIVKLTDSSVTVAKQMEDSGQLQVEMMKKQNESIKNQEMLIEKGSELKDTLEESTIGVQKMLVEFKDSTTEQRQLIFEVFDRVNSLQSVVMGEFTGFYSLIFYTISVLVSYLLTSTPRTSGARFWLFVLMTVNMVIERFIVMYGVLPYEDEEGLHFDENTLLYARLWWCRRMFMCLAVLLWIFCAYQYKDLNRINNQLLLDIQKQNSDLKYILQTAPPPQKTTELVPVHPSRQTNVGANDINMWRKSIENSISHMPTPDAIDYNISKVADSSSTGYDTWSDEESLSSWNSQASDHTFVCDGHSSDSEAESFMTGVSGRTSSIMDELEYLRSATPPFNSSVLSVVSSGGSPKKRGRPRGRRSNDTLSPHTHNLRSRRGKTSTRDNPVIYTESAEDFGRTIQQMALQSQQNQHLANNMSLNSTLNTTANTAVCNGHGRYSTTPSSGFFSSDDES